MAPSGDLDSFPTVSLGHLWTSVSGRQVNTAKDKIVAARITDVLGKGWLPKQPVVVKAKFVRRRQGVGGKGGAACW